MSGCFVRHGCLARKGSMRREVPPVQPGGEARQPYAAVRARMPSDTYMNFFAMIVLRLGCGEGSQGRGLGLRSGRRREVERGEAILMRNLWGADRCAIPGRRWESPHLAYEIHV